ncbi:angiopoietin-related protein 4 [Microcaecilia unicolor]|uniref:Angiopoietin-related protein 4-like n=1 Tax=Microcaecilia unicolor TaxID=1415580 RepID=A0A6P7ZLI4_9AMPH|nr:angiopoietin-related protein 4-like [Microcaecilia unicolor]
MQWSYVVVVLCSSLLAGQVGAFLSERRNGGASPLGKEKKVQFASWDEVNVIAHGLLQLGHGLKEHVDKTKGQLREIAGQLGRHNASLGELQQEDRELRGKMEGSHDRLHNLSQELQEAARGRESLERRLQSIEGRIGRALHPPPAEEWGRMQSFIDAQNKRIDELLGQVKLQQYSLDKQNLQIKSLQSKIQDKTQGQAWHAVLKKQSKGISENQSVSTVPTHALSADCHQLFLAGQRSSGVSWVQPARSPPLEVFCDMAADGGWTVIQRRMNGSVDFDQLWEAYRKGIGNLNGEFWLGLEKMFHLAQQRPGLLRIELQDWEGQSRYIEFLFSLGGQDTGYTLYLHGRVSGNLDNAMREVEPLRFSTRDRDQDLKPDINCAKHLSGGWWFSSCGHTNLNGRYFHSIPRQRHERKQGIFWKTWKGRYYPLKATVIKMRTMEPGSDS